MKIVVCVKQVPDTTEVKIDPATNTLVRQGVPSILNPFDRNAVEAAVQIKEKNGGRVIILSMGPPQAKDALKECLAMGADEAVLLSDRAFGGADTLATSYTLAAGIRKLGDVDLIICGKQAIDGDTAQVGPEIAEHLGIPQVTYAAKIEIKDNKIVIDRENEEGYEIIEAKAPLLVTVVKSINKPRYPTVKGILRANRQEIKIWTIKDIDIIPDKLGLKGSPTQVRRIFPPKQRTRGEIIKADTSREAVNVLLQKMTEAKLIAGGI